MVKLPIILLIALIGYALAITGLFLCAFAGSASDRQKHLAIIATLKSQVKHFIIETDKALRELDTTKTSLKQTQTLANERQERIVELLHDYVRVQNEYAWFRLTYAPLVPEAPLSAESAGNKEATRA